VLTILIRRYHPLWKIIAQISFGLHLLAKGLAKSEADVMRILQSHVAELDGFIERTTEDFVLARNDIWERLKFLRLPLENLDVFDGLLEDRSFRLTVIKDNERLEHIIGRSAAAMNDSFKDIQKGIDSVHALRHYLERLGKEWNNRSRNQDAVYEAMLGNIDGWNREFDRLRKKGYNLAFSLIQLSKMVSEMQRRVGVASRKTVVREKRAPSRTVAGIISVLTLKQALANSNTSPTLGPRAHTLQKLSGGISEKPLPGYPKDPNPVIVEAVPSQVLAEKMRLSFPAGADDATFSVERDTFPSRSRSPSDTSRRCRDSVGSPCLSPKTTTVKGSRGAEIARENARYDSAPTPTTTRPVSAPSGSQKSCSHSPDEFEKNLAQGKWPFRMALESFVQLEKRKLSASTARKDRRVKFLQRSKSKTFDILRLSGTKEQMGSHSRSNRKVKQVKVLRFKASTDHAETTPWSDFEREGTNTYSNTYDDQMTWSHEAFEVHDTYTFKANPSGPPQFPHLVFVADSPDQNFIEEELKDDSSVNSEDEARLTALPSLRSPLEILDDNPASPTENIIRNGRTDGPNSNVRLASSKYSNMKNRHSRNLKIFNSKASPTQGVALESPDYIPTAGGDVRHVVNQSYHWLVRRPSLFSLRSSRKGSETQSLSSVGSSMSDPRSKPQSTGISITTPAGFPSAQIRIPSSIDEYPTSTGSAKQQEPESGRARLGLGMGVGTGNDPDDLYRPGSRPPPSPGGRAMVSPNQGAQNALKGEKHTKFRTAFDEGARRLLSPKRSVKSLLLGASSKEAMLTNPTSASSSRIQDHSAANSVRIRIRPGTSE
jgi:hypothetical protein